MTANLAYVAVTRETHRLEVITDDVDKLCAGICKFADRQSAMEASKQQVSPDIEEIRQARHAADHELGQAGDLAEKRAEQERAHEHEEESEHVEAPEREELEDEMEL